MNTQVSLADCTDYEPEGVYAAMKRCLEPLGGMEAFVRHGQRVLLQVNLISPRPPEDAVCTHPSVVRAVCRLVHETGGLASVGGSAGGSAYRRTGAVMRTSGIAAAAAQEAAELVNYDEVGGQDVPSRGHLLPTIHLAKPVLEADVLITLPKMKTHSLTLLTGAVKNHLGTLPGPRKAELHRRFPDPEQFGEALLDIYATAPPHLAIMDAIQGMDGDGPTAGHPRAVGILAASADGIALDTVMSAVCGLNDRWVPTLSAARRRGLGTTALANIDVVGIPLDLARRRTRPFAYPMTYQFMAHAWVPQWARAMAAKYLTGSPIPYVVTPNCNGCQTCLQSCPSQAITVVEKRARIDQKSCISCFCCHEVCLQQAIGIKVPLLWRRMRV